MEFYIRRSKPAKTLKSSLLVGVECTPSRRAIIPLVQPGYDPSNMSFLTGEGPRPADCKIGFSSAALCLLIRYLAIKAESGSGTLSKVISKCFLGAALLPLRR